MHMDMILWSGSNTPLFKVPNIMSMTSLINVKSKALPNAKLLSPIL